MTGRWFVIQFNIKCEDKAARNLRRAGFRPYMPVARFERIHRRTKRTIVKTLPLLGRYMFVWMPPGRGDFKTLRECQGVESLLYADGRPYEIPRKQVLKLYLAERQLEFDDTTEADLRRGSIKNERHARKKAIFRKGRAIRVKNGAFAMFTGHVEGVNARGDIEVLVQLFGRLTPVAVRNADDLEPIDEKVEAA